MIKISTKKIIIILILGIPLSIFSYIGAKNYSGFCFAQNRHLTDEEKFRIVFNDINSRLNTTIVVGVGQNYARKTVQRIPYNSFEEYKKENMNCCKTGRRIPSEIPKEEFDERIFGLDSGVTVTLDFKTKYFDKDSNYYGVIGYTHYYILTNCGKVRKSQTDATINPQK
jgi:hypothetical protein